MSGKVKASISIIIVALLLAGAYYWYTTSKKPVTQESTQVTDTTNQAPAGPTLATGADTSDGALEKDVASVDAEMNAMASDVADIDSSLNDKPVPQN